MTEGYELFEAGDGDSALLQARAELPDLILLDVILPDMEGGEIVSQLRASSLTQNIPVVFLTGILSKSDAENGQLEIRVGTEKFKVLAKPFDLEQVQEMVANTLSGF